MLANSAAPEAGRRHSHLSPPCGALSSALQTSTSPLRLNNRHSPYLPTTTLAPSTPHTQLPPLPPALPTTTPFSLPATNTPSTSAVTSPCPAKPPASSVSDKSLTNASSPRTLAAARAAWRVLADAAWRAAWASGRERGGQSEGAREWRTRRSWGDDGEASEGAGVRWSELDVRNCMCGPARQLAKRMVSNKGTGVGLRRCMSRRRRPPQSQLTSHRVTGRPP